MREAADLTSAIEGGRAYASFRAVFADEIGVQFVGTTRDELVTVFEGLHAPMFDLVRFAEQVLLERISRVLIQRPSRRTEPSESRSVSSWRLAHLRALRAEGTGAVLGKASAGKLARRSASLGQWPTPLNRLALSHRPTSAC